MNVDENTLGWARKEAGGSPYLRQIVRGLASDSGTRADLTPNGRPLSLEPGVKLGSGDTARRA